MNAHMDGIIRRVEGEKIREKLVRAGVANDNPIVGSRVRLQRHLLVDHQVSEIEIWLPRGELPLEAIHLQRDTGQRRDSIRRAVLQKEVEVSNTAERVGQCVVGREREAGLGFTLGN